ncbi:MAG TPA: DUF2357 domain-containing protein [Bryobacteraceae bacterium]|jgi:hypothetical protein|nr:DUF2357 domain-containing protein [Bryobacteraceae bacterium]
MPDLLIRSERTGAAWRVWPDADLATPGAVQETGSYLFELTGAADASKADLLIDDQPLEALRTSSRSTGRWRWKPGFHAGTVEAELRLPGTNPRRFEIVTDPDLRKLTRDDFDVMVREILEDTFALFSLSSFRKSIARGAGSKPPALARLEFLRSRIDELECVVAEIVRSPRRRLAAEETVLPWHRATRVTGPEILKSFRSGRILTEVGKPSRLPEVLQGYLPDQIRVRRRRSSLDLPEHRQMAACLRWASAWLAGVAEILGRPGSAEDVEASQVSSVWALRCRRLARRLSRMSMAEPFAEAADAAPRLMLSSLFRNDPAYRRFFRLWQDMNLGIAAVFGNFLNMPLARTFELYELWCFLRLVRAGVEEFGPQGTKVDDLFVTDGVGGLTHASGAIVAAVGGGWKLCFQKTYREYWFEPDRRGSFSRTMTPDVAAVYEASNEGAPGDGVARLIILDAKYRIDEGLNAALNSIHTYRDALVREAESGAIEGIVTAAYLLTPYLPVLGDAYQATALPGRLFHPEYRTAFRFGAVTMRPGMSTTELTAALQTIVSDATS